MPEQSLCAHKRTQIIAKDKDSQYLECLECGAILEAGELENPSDADGETLGDA